MAESRGEAREAQAEHMELERRTEIAASQPGLQEGYTPDIKVIKVVKKLLGYLQPMVTLMAMMISPIEESKTCEKRDREALAQATSMVLTVSIFV